MFTYTPRTCILPLLERCFLVLPEMNSEIYFDNNATTRLLPEVKLALIETINNSIGNPSSPHSYGDYSRDIIRGCKEEVSQLLNCSEKNIVITSGATESNLSIFNSLTYSDIRTVITTPAEHSSVSENVNTLNSKNYNTHILKINKNGIIDLIELKELLIQNSNTLVSIGWASNETGVIQPIKEISELCKKYNALFHTDASQFVGRGKIDLSSLNIDFLSFTGHKIHAPQGIGVLYIKNRNTFTPLFRGGEQENGLRSGTENIIGISGLKTAIKLRNKDLESSIIKLREIRDYFESVIKKNIKDITINGAKSARVPNTSNIHFHNIDGKALLAQLNMEGVYCSQTSACTSMIPEPSKTLRAMGLTVDEAFASLRFSFAIDNTLEEVDNACSIIKEKVEKIRKFNLIRGAV